jgi:hypothetical protein
MGRRGSTRTVLRAAEAASRLTIQLLWNGEFRATRAEPGRSDEIDTKNAVPSRPC